jgi:pyruvate/2-oxoglutarate dehydrogenase complex dihydrolipoamide acyltransferase (E2) component
MANQDIQVPDIGDFKDVEVIDVLVKPGDSVEVDTPLITIETEKATMDVPSTAAGKVESLAVKKGDRVSKGSLILSLAGAGTAPAKAVKAAEKLRPLHLLLPPRPLLHRSAPCRFSQL